MLRDAREISRLVFGMPQQTIRPADRAQGRIMRACQAASRCASAAASATGCCAPCAVVHPDWRPAAIKTIANEKNCTLTLPIRIIAISLREMVFDIVSSMSAGEGRRRWGKILTAPPPAGGQDQAKYVSVEDE